MRAEAAGQRVGAGNWSDDAATTPRTVCDVAGNCTAAQVTGIKVDRSPPTVTCAALPTGWSKVNLAAPCTAADAGAGLVGSAQVAAATTLPAGREDAAAPASVRVCDAAGNCPTLVVGAASIDRKGPSVVCAAPDGAWHTVNVSLTCEQSDGGVGLAGGLPNGSSFSATTVVALGQESVNARATAASRCDAVGNCTAVLVAGNKVDRKAPTAVCGARDDAWHTDNVTVTCTPSDGASGVDPTPFPSSTTVSPGAETSSASMTKTTVCDVAGNCASIGGPPGWKIDRKGPKVTVASPAANLTVLAGSSFTLSFTCSDAGSGLAGCSGPQPSGTTITPTALGPGSFDVTALDLAGNLTTVTVRYTVVAPITGTVLTLGTSVPIDGVEVTVHPSAGGPAVASATTDATGRYQVAGLPAGSYKLKATKPGYLDQWLGGSATSTTKVVTFDGAAPVTLAPFRLKPLG